MNSHFILIAFRNIALAKRRTILLGLALAIVSTLFIMLNALTKGVSEKMIDGATTLAAGHVNVGGFFKLRAKGAAAVINERQRLRKLVHDAIPDALIIDRQRGWGRLIGPQSSINVGVSGLNIEEESKFFASVVLAQEKDYKEGGSEQVFGNLSHLSQKNSALIFAGQAKKLGAQVGDRLTIVSEGSGGQTNSIDLTVVAIVKDIGMLSNWNLFVPRATVLDLYHVKEDTTGVIMVYLKDMEQAEEKMALLKSKLSAEGFAIMEHDPNPFYMKFDKVFGEDWLGQKLDLTLWKDEISFVLWVSTAMNLITFIIIIILSFIIASGIANAMWMTVRERVKEIGTMRAMGAYRRQILWIFLLEALFLALIFVGGAAIFSTALILFLNSLKITLQNESIRFFLMTDTLYFALSFSQIFQTLLLFCFVSMLGALFPALRAARLQPVDALRQGK